MTEATKCQNYFMKLIDSAKLINPQTVENVRNLVKEVIDDCIQVQLFTDRIQTELLKDQVG